MRTWIALGCLLLSGCAQLYHVQISDIDNTEKDATKFDVKASDTGVDLNEAAGLAKAVSSNRALHRASNSISALWTLVTYGPRTGNVTFSDNYADDVVASLVQACPSRRIASLMAIREAAKYPVVSGEIVHFKGYCLAAPHARSRARKRL